MDDQITVLLADDVEEHRNLARQMLHAEGYQVIEAKDYETTITALKNHKVGIVLCDLMMPGNGMEVIDYLRQEFPDLPRVVISARRRPPGMDEIYVLKPYRIKDLLWAIDLALEK